MKKPNFSDKARSILASGSRPKSLEEFFNENEPPKIVDLVVEKEETSQKFVREEFRFPLDLAERLRVASFKTKKKKTKLTQEALDEYLDKLGL